MDSMECGSGDSANQSPVIILDDPEYIAIDIDAYRGSFLRPWRRCLGDDLGFINSSRGCSGRSTSSRRSRSIKSRPVSVAAQR